MRTHFLTVLVVLVAAAIADARAANFSVSPLRVELSAGAPVAVIEVGNSAAEPVVVQAQSRLWSQATGQDVYSEARPFIISPPIFTIAPAGRQVVRIALRGAPPSEVEGAYRLLLTEIPSSRTGDAPGLRVALRIDVPVYVTPLRADAQSNARFALDPGDGAPRIAVRNDGNAHFRMVDVTVSDDTGRLAELPVLVVLPGATRTIDLPGAKSSGSREFRLKADSNSGPIDVAVRHGP